MFTFRTFWKLHKTFFLSCILSNSNKKGFHFEFVKFHLFRMEKGILIFGQNYRIPDLVFGLTRKKVVQNSNLQGVMNASGLKLVVHSDYRKRQNMFLNQTWQQLTVKSQALTLVTK